MNNFAQSTVTVQYQVTDFTLLDIKAEFLEQNMLKSIYYMLKNPGFTNT